MIRLVSLTVEGFKNLKIKNLIFPKEGNILICGRNESGKSSLFESVFFALTSELLVSESRGFKDAVAFDKNSATVDLVLQKDGIPARIKKTVSKKRQGTSLAVEFYKNYGQDNETVHRGRRNEIDPLIEEFVEFDGEILRNSCFVKQKGLEGFIKETREVRKKIIGKLLNLDRLSELRVQYKDDLKEKEVVRDYFANKLTIDSNTKEIESLNEELHEMRTHQSNLEECNSNLSLLSQLATRNTELEGIFNENSNQIKTLNSEIKHYTKELQEVSKNKKVFDKLQEEIHALDLLQKDLNSTLREKKNDEEKIEKLKELLKEIKKREQETHEQKTEYNLGRQKLAQMDEWLSYLSEIEAINNNLVVERNSIKMLEEQHANLISELESMQQNLDHQIQSVLKNLKEKCTQHKELVENITSLKGPEKEELEKTEKPRKYSILLKSSPMYGSLLIAGILLSVFLSPWFLPLAIIGAILGVLILLAELKIEPFSKWMQKTLKYLSAWWEKTRKPRIDPNANLIASLEKQLDNMELDISKQAKSLGCDDDEISEIITTYNIQIKDPKKNDDKKSKQADLVTKKDIQSQYGNIKLLEVSLPSIYSKIEMISKNREDVKKLSKSKASKTKKIKNLHKRIPNQYFDKKSELEQEHRKLGYNISKLEKSLEMNKKFLKKNSLENTRRELETTEKRVKHANSKIKSLRDDIDQCTNEIEKFKLAIPEKYQNVDMDELKDSMQLEIANRKEKVSHLESNNSTLWDEHATKLKDWYSKNSSNISSIKPSKELYEKKAFKKISSILNKTSSLLKTKCAKIEKKVLKRAPEHLEISAESFLTVFLEEEQIKIGALQNEIEKAEEFILKQEKHKRKSRILDKSDLTPKNMQKAYEKLQRDVNITHIAVDILDEGEIMLSQKVLPKTIENLTRILPILTADRYKDATISTDYTVKIFDSKLGDYVEKGLFSGGTNDQIALSIRLAFAMATMEDDRGNESFIFLDEPLGFFDDERRSALIDFLTHGMISQKFSQRIVISNYLEIKPYFDFVIELANGTIISQTVTGSLDTTQYESDYKSLDEISYLDLQLEEHYEDDGYCETVMRLKNISDKPISSIKLEKNETNADITPTYITDLKSQQFTQLYINYMQYVLEEEDLKIDAHIKISKSRGKPILTKQTLVFKPVIE